MWAVADSAPCWSTVVFTVRALLQPLSRLFSRALTLLTIPWGSVCYMCTDLSFSQRLNNVFLAHRSRSCTAMHLGPGNCWEYWKIILLLIGMTKYVFLQAVNKDGLPENSSTFRQRCYDSHPVVGCSNITTSSFLLDMASQLTFDGFSRVDRSSHSVGGRHSPWTGHRSITGHTHTHTRL